MGRAVQFLTVLFALALVSSADAKLSYTASTDRYKEIVATNSSWKGTCRILRLDLADGTYNDVRVSFK